MSSATRLSALLSAQYVQRCHLITQQSGAITVEVPEAKQDAYQPPPTVGPALAGTCTAIGMSGPGSEPSSPTGLSAAASLPVSGSRSSPARSTAVASGQ